MTLSHLLSSLSPHPDCKAIFCCLPQPYTLVEIVTSLALGDGGEGGAAVPARAKLVGEGQRARDRARSWRCRQTEESLERIIHLYQMADAGHRGHSPGDAVGLLVLDNVGMLLVDVQAP